MIKERTFTPDYEKAKLAVQQKKEANAHLIQDFSDENHWKSLASKYGVRLPRYYIANSETKYLKRLFKKVEIDIQEYLDACGVSTLKQLVKLNPDYPAYAEIGLALEYVDEIKKS